MKLFNLLYLIFQSFRVRTSRVFFTILGISIGIGTILFLVSLGYGLQKILLEKITTTESLLTLDVVPPETGIISLKKEVLEKILKIEGVEKISPRAIFAGQVSFSELISEAQVNLVNSDFFVLEGMAASKGRFFKEREQAKIVINSSLAEIFNLKEVLGKKLSISLFLPEEERKGIFKSKEDFEVIGLIEETTALNQVFLNLSDFEDLAIKEYQFLKVKVENSEVMEGVRAKLIEMGFLVSALSDTIAQANKIFRAIQIILGIFGVVALIVAAIGLVNTMTISLLQRINEIGIMRAIGASAGDIKTLFWGEAILIGFLGGIFGIGMGIGFAEIFNLGISVLAKSLGGQPIKLFFYPKWFLVFIIFLSIFVGLIGGIFPAKRAARMNPLEALRYK